MLNFRSNEDLGKLTKEYLTDLVCKFGAFCLQHSETFDISHVFLRAIIAQTGIVFLTHPVAVTNCRVYRQLEFVSDHLAVIGTFKHLHLRIAYCCKSGL